jgi:hypothetical protein
MTRSPSSVANPWLTPFARPQLARAAYPAPTVRAVLQFYFGVLATLIFIFVAPRVHAQAFVAEWNAQASGGVAPTGLLFATENGVSYVYASDHPRGRVLKMNATTGEVLLVIGKQGTASGDLNAPYGLARDPSTGDIYVAERGNNRVSRFTSAGVFVMSWGLVGTAQGQLGEPFGVAVDPVGDVYVSEYGNHRVQKFRVTQTNNVWGAASLAMWGTLGSGVGQFNRPQAVTADAVGNIWVVDSLNGRVQRFNASGVYQSTLGAPGSAPGQFIVPTWLNVAPNGELFVASTSSNPQDGTLADASNQWISRFTSAGTFISRWGGSYGQAPGQFRLPHAVIVGTNNRAYVADYYNNRVQVFDVTPAGTDNIAPTLAMFAVGTSNATTVNFLVTFSEPVTGVNSSDFTAVTTGAAAATIGTVTGSGTSYTVPVTYSGTGTVQLNLNGSGTGIVDAANNPIGAGYTGPVFTISTPGPTTTQVIGVTPPPNGTYGKNQELTFVVRFNGNVTVTGESNNQGKGSEDDDEDASIYFTWTAVSVPGQAGDSGKVRYISGSGSSSLTFALKVHNGDMAPGGILLSNVLRVDSGAAIRDANGVVLDAQKLTLAWTQNPLTGVILDAPKPGNGNGGTGNNGNGNGNGKGRSDRLVNLSSRLRVTGGDASRSVVVGFVVTGETSKQILIRAVGPGLAGFGVRDALDQPVLVLRDSTGKTIAENDGWKNHPDISSAGDKVGAFRLNNGSKDAALVVTLTPGAYTAQVTANGNGIVLVEVYDTVAGSQLSTEQIVNISTRGFVGTGDDVLVAGFVVTGGTPKRILVRGIGPALAAFGVPNTVTDPVLRVYPANSGTPLAQNDNWETPQQIGAQSVATAAELTTASLAVGAFPLSAGGKDAALIVTLPAGSYSAVVSGANNGTGAGLVEIYELP